MYNTDSILFDNFSEGGILVWIIITKNITIRTTRRKSALKRNAIAVAIGNAAMAIAVAI
jgi:hypothetical protein